MMKISLSNYGQVIAILTVAPGRQIQVEGIARDIISEYLSMEREWVEGDLIYKGSAKDGLAYLQRALLASKSWFGDEFGVEVDWDKFLKLEE